MASETINPWPLLIARLNRSENTYSHVQNDLLKLNENELKQIDARCSVSMHDTYACYASEVSALNMNEMHHYTRDKNEISEPRVELSQDIIDRIESNKVTSTEAAYEFEEGNQIGFCFGRALVAHYLLLEAGVKQEDMRKVFAIGELMVNRQIWRFHVAVMVRNGEGSWLVVDPLHSKPMPIEQWTKKMESYDIKAPFSRTRFYVSDVRKFMPSTGLYDLEAFMQPELRAYFNRLGESLSGGEFNSTT